MPRMSEATEPQPTDEREGAYALLQRGHELLRKRHHAQAAVVLERAGRLEPGRGSIMEALGRAYYNSGDYDRAAEAFGRLVEIDPVAAYGHFGRMPEKDGGFSWERTDLADALKRAMR